MNQKSDVISLTQTIMSIKMKKIALIFIIFFVQVSYSIDSHNELKSYINQLIVKVSQLLNNENLSDQMKLNHCSNLILANLDLDWMAKYTLGRHKKVMTEAQIQEFKKNYSTYIIKTYLDLIKNYKGEQVKIKKIQNLSNNEFIVSTTVSREQISLNVDYFIKKVDINLFLISDIITEGMSIINSQKAEFNNIILTHSIDYLISKMKK